MSKQDEAGLILKLYELRREESMRQARDWFTMEFNPATIDDIRDAMFSANSAKLRMVLSYWDMAAALVNNGAIDLQLFTDTNGEHFAVFSKVELLLPEMRQALAPTLLSNLEKLIDATPAGRERSAQTRERMAQVQARVAAARTAGKVN